MSGFRVIARPHDELLKRQQKLISDISRHFENKGLFTLETNLGNVKSIQSAALLIADWGGIVFEWAFAKERPAMLINTNMKVRNKSYLDLGIAPMEILAREHLGKNVALEDMKNAGEYARDLLKNKEAYVKKIRDFRKRMIYNFGNSAEVGARYILSLL
jgi:hypothetical protein